MRVCSAALCFLRFRFFGVADPRRFVIVCVHYGTSRTVFVLPGPTAKQTGNMRKMVASASWRVLKHIIYCATAFNAAVNELPLFCFKWSSSNVSTRVKRCLSRHNGVLVAEAGFEWTRRFRFDQLGSSLTDGQ